MKRKVYIAIPSTDGNVNVSLAQLTLAAARMSGDREFMTRYFVGYRPVAYMRNSIFGAFLATDCDLLWMLDQDIIPPPRAFDVLGVEDDIVAGMIPGYKVAQDGSGFVLQVLAFQNGETGPLRPIELPRDGEVRKVDGAGAGCMVIHRRVLEDDRMRREPDPAVRPLGWAPAIYHVPLESSGMMQTSGDLDFCTRAKALGYSISLWTEEMYGQRETLDLRDVAAFGARCASQVEVTK